MERMPLASAMGTASSTSRHSFHVLRLLRKAIKNWPKRFLEKIVGMRNGLIHPFA